MTGQEIKRLWEWCGLKLIDRVSRDGRYSEWVDTNSNAIVFHTSKPPKYTLDNLAKYAVPNIPRLSRVEFIYHKDRVTANIAVWDDKGRLQWISHGEGKNEAEALAKALLGVIDEA